MGGLPTLAVLQAQKGPDRLSGAAGPGGPAAQAGLRGGTAQVATPIGPVFLRGDVITAVGGQTIETAADLREYLCNRQAGEQVTLTVNRAGQTLTLSVTLAAGTPPPSGNRWAARRGERKLTALPLTVGGPSAC